MVSEEKLIRQGIRLTDEWFRKFKKQIEHDLELCETYEEFIERTKEYTTNNILINSGYAAEMGALVTQILNNHKFARASQRALLEQTINNNVGMLIQDVGEDIKETVRTVVKQGYDEGSHPTVIARNISGEIDKINNTRARTIARTEVKRTDTVATYVRHKENGAIGFTVQCRPDCCPLCAEDYGNKNPKEQKARLDWIKATKKFNKGKPKSEQIDDPLLRGKGETIGGNVQFGMNDTRMLPPRHPNCRCTAMYVYGETIEPVETTTTPSKGDTVQSDIIQVKGLENADTFKETIKSDNKKLYQACKRHDCFDEVYNILSESEVTEFDLKDVQIVDISKMKKEELKEFIQYTNQDLFWDVYDKSWQKFCEAYDLMYEFATGEVIIDDWKVLEAVCEGINEIGESICYPLESKSKNKKGGQTLMLAIDF